MKGLRPGDVFVRNGRTLRLVETRLLTAKVAAADRAVPTVPRWYANKMPLASGLAAEVVRLRTEMARQTGSSCPDSSGQGLDPHRRDADATTFLQFEYALSPANARALTEHFTLQAQVSRIPTSAFFLVEQFAQRGLVHVFFHSLIGLYHEMYGGSGPAISAKETST